MARTKGALNKKPTNASRVAKAKAKGFESFPFNFGNIGLSVEDMIATNQDFIKRQIANLSRRVKRIMQNPDASKYIADLIEKEGISLSWKELKRKYPNMTFSDTTKIMQQYASINAKASSRVQGAKNLKMFEEYTPSEWKSELWRTYEREIEGSGLTDRQKYWIKLQMMEEMGSGKDPDIIAQRIRDNATYYKEQNAQYERLTNVFTQFYDLD